MLRCLSMSLEPVEDDMKIGDLVMFKPKNYGPDIKDQWVGLTGVIVEHNGDGSVSVLVTHPDDNVPADIFAFEDDLMDVHELTMEQLETVIGGMSPHRFDHYRTELINETKTR